MDAPERENRSSDWATALRSRSLPRTYRRVVGSTELLHPHVCCVIPIAVALWTETGKTNVEPLQEFQPERMTSMPELTATRVSVPRSDTPDSILIHVRLREP